MTTPALTPIADFGAQVRSGIKQAIDTLWKTPDLLTLGILIVLSNLHLVGIGTGRELIFYPRAVLDGNWWRLLTHPFVHLTGYHFALDAGAFWLLYRGLEETRIGRKTLLLLTCGASSLAAAMMLSSQISTLGLCGLSGIAHGLMAFSGLEMARSRETRRIGLASFLIVFIKSIYEAATGEVFFSFLHMGLCGTPVAACHLGGVLGGIAAYLLFGSMDRLKTGSRMLHHTVPAEHPGHGAAERRHRLATTVWPL